MADKYLTFTTAENDGGKRLDSVVRALLPHLGLSHLQKAIRRGDIRLDSRRAKPEARVKPGQTLEVYKALASSVPEEHPSPPDLPVESWVLFRDQDFVVFNKPVGILVHGPGSLDAAAKAWLEPQLPPSLSFRPGPLHRLDRNTSGLVVFSASLAGARRFSQALRERALKKDYLALVSGDLDRELVLEHRLTRDQGDLVTREGEGGRSAHTRIRPLVRRRDATLVLCRIDTGITHQIRAQAALAGYPLLGDGKYGGGPGTAFLHAWRLAFRSSPESGWEAPLSRDQLQWGTRFLGPDWEGALEDARKWSKSF